MKYNDIDVGRIVRAGQHVPPWRLDPKMLYRITEITIDHGTAQNTLVELEALTDDEHIATAYGNQIQLADRILP